MKKWTAYMFVAASALLLAGCSAGGTRPYQALTAEEIVSASVHLAPPDTTLAVEDTGKLAALLSDVVVYEEDNSYAQYAGQGVTFSLSMADGTQTSVMAYNPFVVIDGVGYRTEYTPCQALSAYGNELLNAGEAAVILNEPPALTVISDETAFGALLGTYSWQRMESDGTITSVIADSAHPLDLEALLPVFETAEQTAVLRFHEEPDQTIDVRCWSDAHWADTEAESGAVQCNGNTITLKPGGYIYDITAQWDTGSGFGGTAHYAIYIKYTDEAA